MSTLGQVKLTYLGLSLVEFAPG